MKRVALPGFFLCAVSCTSAVAQNAAPPDLAALEQIAQKRTMEWETPAMDLEERLARILPCDPRSSTSIAEAGRLSEARLAALSDYMRAASAQAFAETASARGLLNAEERRAAETGRERADAGQEQTAVDIQSDALTQSAARRTSLQDAEKLLQEISSLIRQRSTDVEQQAGAADKNVELLRGLITKFEARDAALRDESAAFEAERSRWSGYYSARLARAQIECSITQVGAAPAQGKARAKGKQ